MSPRNYFFAVMTFVAVAIGGCGGCGGGGDSTSNTPVATTTTGSGTLSKAELIQQGDGICAEVNAAVGTVNSSTTDEATSLSQESDLYSGMMERLKGLGTPSDSTGLDAVYKAGDDLVQAQKSAQLAAERGDSAALSTAQSDATTAFGNFQNAASSYGFKDCGKAAAAPQGTSTTTTPVVPSTPAPTTTPTAPVTPVPAPVPAPAPAPPTGGGTSGGTGGGTTGGGSPSGGGGTSGGIGPG